MQELVLSMVWLFFYGYEIGQTGTLQKGAGRRVTAAFLATGMLVAAFFWKWAGGPEWSMGLAWLLIAILFLFFDLFFDEEAFRYQWWKVLLPGVAMAVLSFLLWNRFLCNAIVCYLFFALLAGKRGYFNWKNGTIVAFLYGMLFLVAWITESGVLVLVGTSDIVFAEQGKMFLRWSVIAFEILLFAMVEGTLYSYKRGFEFQTERFEQDILNHQYEEIKAIYMNMRGWRHDYHNHLQVIKAQLALGNLEETGRYLDELEQDLDQVDTYVKSGNLMVDAILNSKLTLAKAGEVAVNCKAVLPQELSVEDVDLCVILGNLLDNALEACEKIPKEQRFLRIYMAVNQSQLYISIQNSAKEELDFNEKNYITNKRGNHGFGMRRVKAMIEKYEGYLNLANEPGIFAAEVTMPLDIS